MNIKTHIEKTITKTCRGVVEVQFAGRTIFAKSKAELMRKVRAEKDALSTYQRRRLLT